MTYSSRLATVLLALLVVATIGVGLPVAAQQAPANNTTNTTTGTGAGAGAGAGADAGNNTTDGGGGGVVPGVGTGIDLPSPKEMAAELLVAFGTSLANGAAGLVDMFSAISYTVSAPGDPLNPQSWITDTSGWYDAVWRLWAISWSFSFVLYAVALTFVFEEPDPRVRRGKMRRVGKAFVIGQFPGVIVAVGGYHLTNAAALMVAPDGAEFLQSPDNLAKLGIGLLLPVVLLIVNASVVILGTFVLIGIYALSHLVLTVWSLAWAFTVVPSEQLQHWGRTIISGYTTLPLLTITQAWIAAFVFNTSWNLGSVEEAGATVLAMIGTAVALFFSHIGMPVMAFKKMVPAGVAVMSSRAAEKTGGHFDARVQQVQDRLRGGGTGQSSEPSLGAAPPGRGPSRRQRVAERVGRVGSSADSSAGSDNHTRPIGGVGGARHGSGPGMGHRSADTERSNGRDSERARRRRRRVARGRQRVAYDNNQR